MNQVIAVAVALVVGGGLGYGFRGWIQRKRDAAVAEARALQNAAAQEVKNA